MEAVIPAATRPNKPVIVKNPVAKSQLLAKKPKSLKAQLKKEIESLKRAKQLEQQRKIMEKQQKQREAEQKRLQQLKEEKRVTERAHAMEQERKKQEQRVALEKQMWQQQCYAQQQHYGMGIHATASYGLPLSMNPPYSTVMWPGTFVTPAKGETNSWGAQSASPHLAAPATNQVTPTVPPSEVPCANQATPKASDSTPAMRHSPASDILVDSATSAQVNVPFQPVKSQDYNISTLHGLLEKEPIVGNDSQALMVTSVPIRNAAPDEIISKTETPPCVEHKENVPIEPVESQDSVPIEREPITGGHLDSQTFASQMVTFVPPALSGNPASFLPTSLPPASSDNVVAGTWVPGFDPVNQIPALTYAWPLERPVPLYPFNAFQEHFVAAPSKPRPLTKPVPKVEKPPVLHSDPLNPMSPYAETHELVPGEIVIFKAPGESFGVSFKQETWSKLIDPELLESVKPKPGELQSGLSNAHEITARSAGGKNASRLKPCTDKCDTSLVSGDMSADVSKETDTAKAQQENAIKAHENRNDVNMVVPTETLLLSSASTGASDVSKTAIDEDASVVAEIRDSNSMTEGQSSATSQSNTADKASVKPRRRRRKRVYFSVLKIVTAEKQNARFKVEDPNKQLQPGDLVLYLNGRSVGGLTFGQACGLFASCNTPTEAAAVVPGQEYQPATIRCPLVVARMKPRPARPALTMSAKPCSQSVSSPPSIIPVVEDSSKDQFTDTEMLALAQGAMRCLLQPSRTLGYSTPADFEIQCSQVPALVRRDCFGIKAKWAHFVRTVEESMQKAAVLHWKSQWKLEIERFGMPDLQIEYFSDARRAQMRQLPRPAKGCRCGSIYHERVNDIMCVLYRDLRGLSPEREQEVGEKRKGVKQIKMSNLNAVETAFMDRILKLKEETELEKEEARFVEAMEEQQARQSPHKAVFAPNFTAMVLSSIAEVSATLPGSEEDLVDIAEDAIETIAANKILCNPTATSASSQESAGPMDAEDDEDDDVPLMALGKRSGPPSLQADAKRTKAQSEDNPMVTDNVVKAGILLDLAFLAKVLRHLSLTWGHLYTEPSDADYAW